MTIFTVTKHLKNESFKTSRFGSGTRASEEEIDYLAHLIIKKGVNHLDLVPIDRGLSGYIARHLMDDLTKMPDLTFQQVQERERAEQREKQERKDFDDLRAGAKASEKDENRDAFSASDIASIKIGTQFTAKIKHDFHDRIDAFVGTIDRREPRKGRVRVVGYLTKPGGEATKYRHNVDVNQLVDVAIKSEG